MTLDKHLAHKLLADGDLRRLFVEALGWDQHTATLEVALADGTHSLQALAQKRGMVAWHCPTPSGEGLPSYAKRRKIERQVAKSAHEHLIVFTDAANENEIWQWVKREPGKPSACREHPFHRSQPGDALLQKLESIAFTLEEEERLSLTDVTGRVRAGFDVERVTKRFYDRFQKEHAAFLKFISGITERTDREWYASVMLNRLMFVYFIQRKGFLDGDRDYLRNRLNRTRSEHGRDKFYSFYRYFLLRLFHEGLGSIRRNNELEILLGSIPYLNGGLFDVHELERPDRYGESIEIPDRAFERILDYFDQYQWHLDERPLRADNEINPDVLGYIFEKYINQKQMGAYYTKEDITEYISRNTVLPFLFDAARTRCKIAFENQDGPVVWDLLRDDPDRYIYSAARHGADEPLPKDIASGLSPPTLDHPVGEVVSISDIETVRQRRSWSKPAPSTYALPTENWREVIARRRHCEGVRARFAAGDVRDINDLITLNLDIRQFAQDVIESCEGPDLLRAIWHAVERVTILDPTCGSGAFLFAALNILEPLYEACLCRMEAFVADLEQSGEKHGPRKFSDFRKILAKVAAHPSRRYFVFKSIILNNLYGVDIMEEAVEICKLRLFLKLVAQVEPDASQPNLGIEPLPDIDFNIRSGNTLVGYSTYEEIETAIGGKLDLYNAMQTIVTKAADLQEAFGAFRARQIGGERLSPSDGKQDLRRRLRALDEELNEHLARQYDIDASKRSVYSKWLETHRPFHWFVEFHGIINSGGFDVVIGNPPYVEDRKLKAYGTRGYVTQSTGNLYSKCVERSGRLLSEIGRLGVIVPLSGLSTRRMVPYQKSLENRFTALWLSFYSGDAHPSVLFDGVKYRLAIVLGASSRDGEARSFATDYLRWYAVERPFLFSTKIVYAEREIESNLFRFAKLGTSLATSVAKKLLARMPALGSHLRETGPAHITYHRSPVFWIRSLDFEPYFKSASKTRSTDHIRDLYFKDQKSSRRAVAILNSTTFYFWFTVLGNCRNIDGSDLGQLPVGLLSSRQLDDLEDLSSRLMSDFQRHSKRRVYHYKASGRVEYDEFYLKLSKPIIDEIDCVLARHYNLTERELDLLISYDIKYRMGRD